MDTILTPSLPHSHYSITPIPRPSNELVEYTHACPCVQPAFSLLKGNKLRSARSGQRAAKKWQPSDSESKFIC